MKILFVTSRFPYPPVKGDKAIPYYRIKWMSKRHQITLLSFIDSSFSEKDLNHIRNYCSEVHLVPIKKGEVIKNLFFKIAGTLPFQVLYYRSKEFKRKVKSLVDSEAYDLIHVFMFRVGQYLVNYKNSPKILELIDSMGLNMERRAEEEKGIKKIFFNCESERSRAYEREILRDFDKVVVVSQVDKDFIGESNLQVVPIGVDETIFYPGDTIGPANDNVVILTGRMDYFPNKNAAQYFLRKIWPVIKRMIPLAEFHIAGYGAKVFESYAIEDRSLKLFDSVKNIAENIRAATVAVCPTLTGSGMQFKILEALACGVPVVATTRGKGGICIGEDDGLFSEDDPVKFAQKVAFLIQNRELRKTLSLRAHKAVLKGYSWNRSNEKISAIYDLIFEEQ